jgi:hypothetical protein
VESLLNGKPIIQLFKYKDQVAVKEIKLLINGGKIGGTDLLLLITGICSGTLQKIKTGNGGRITLHQLLVVQQEERTILEAIILEDAPVDVTTLEEIILEEIIVVEELRLLEKGQVQETFKHQEMVLEMQEAKVLVLVMFQEVMYQLADKEVEIVKLQAMLVVLEKGQELAELQMEMVHLLLVLEVDLDRLILLEVELLLVKDKEKEVVKYLAQEQVQAAQEEVVHKLIQEKEEVHQVQAKVKELVKLLMVLMEIKPQLVVMVAVLLKLKEQDHKLRVQDKAKDQQQLVMEV